MHKIVFNLFLTSFFLFFTIACDKEHAEEDSWQFKNSCYIDSIASEAKKDPNNWKVLLNYKLGTNLPNIPIWKTDDYVYAKVIKQGDENGISPLYTDSVDVYYKGNLINGFLFDYNFKEDKDFLSRYPTRMAIGGEYGVITGFATALQHMKRGDRWMVYIPAKLGYKNEYKEKIPPFSTLIFEIILEDIIHPTGIDKYLSEEYLRKVLALSQE